MPGETVRFDRSIQRLAECVSAELGVDALQAGVVHRDASGRLSFFVRTEIQPDRAKALSEKLRAALGSYARRDRVLAACNDVGAAAVLGDPSALPAKVGAWTVRVLDRRLVGVDWLRPPVPASQTPPRFVFASMKGGVGRTTALSICASHVAARGGRVLALDLDLEAPGLGPVLLTRDTLPFYGMLDALVENNISGLDTTFYADLIGPSALATQAGKIDVVPAFGRSSVENPGGVLAKLARAYVEDVRPDGQIATLLDQVRGIVDTLGQANNYDLILIDARAGLHESTASALMGLGAEVLLFGLDEPQTFEGYSALLAHLSQFVPGTGPSPEWLDRLTFVQGKAPPDAAGRDDFAGRWRLLVERMIPILRTPSTYTDPVPVGDFQALDWDDGRPDDEVLPPDAAILSPVSVLHDPRYAGFNPGRSRDLLEERLYIGTFGTLLERIDAAVFSEPREAT
jgi:cellulose biosynthesis protein BcsQ